MQTHLFRTKKYVLLKLWRDQKQLKTLLNCRSDRYILETIRKGKPKVKSRQATRPTVENARWPGGFAAGRTLAVETCPTTAIWADSGNKFIEASEHSIYGLNTYQIKHKSTKAISAQSSMGVDNGRSGDWFFLINDFFQKAVGIVEFLFGLIFV